MSTTLVCFSFLKIYTFCNIFCTYFGWFLLVSVTTMSGLFNVCSYEDLTGVSIVGQNFFCLGATFLFFLIGFLVCSEGSWRIVGEEFCSGKWLGLWVRKLELEGLRRGFQVDCVASQVKRWRNGDPLSRWKMEPHQLHHLIGTLMMTMMEVCIGSPYDLLYLYFLLFFFGFLFWLVYIYFFS